MVTAREAFYNSKLIVILRKVPDDRIFAVAEALAGGGAKLCEVTLNSDSALNGISSLREKFGGVIRIGAGTVLSLRDAREAVRAGAEFIVSPNTDEAVIKFCSEREILCLPGALTPTEIASAINSGAEYIKLFPASAFGPGYVKELAGPFGGARFVAVGGINPNNAADYIKAGCFGAAVGGGIVRPDLVKDKRFDEITRLTAEMIKILN